MKIYIRSASAISPQNTFGQPSLPAEPIAYEGNRLQNIEPDYTQLLDARALRRMSRIVKMGVAAGTACLHEAGVTMPGAIVTGTAYGCVQDTTVFLEDIIQRKEEALTPTAFIQSTHNTVGAQIALQLKCHNYNNTFVHRGLSFESALLDALLLLHEKETDTVLAGSIEELTDELFVILSRFDIYKDPSVNSGSKGTVAGEGAAFFLLSSTNEPGTYACLDGAATFYKPKNEEDIEEQVAMFLIANYTKPSDIDLLIVGRNGDAKDDAIYDGVQSSVLAGIPSISYKHLCGEYPTASSFALWMGATILKTGNVPDSLGIIDQKKLKRILIYNHYQGTHHSLLLLSSAD